MSSSYTVLVIDDDPQMLLTLTSYLEDSGYVVLEAHDGQEGIDLFLAHKPDVVITDLRMPKVDGFGVIAAVKEQRPATPVIVFTGTGEHYISSQLVNSGAWCCLYKPLDDMQDLVAAIEMALDKGMDGTLLKG